MRVSPGRVVVEWSEISGFDGEPWEFHGFKITIQMGINGNKNMIGI